MASPFIIETTRLWLRPFAREDVGVLHRMWTDPDVRRYLWDDKVISRDRAAGEVEDSMTSFRDHGFGMWVVLLAGATEVSGFAGFRIFGSPPAKKELMYGIAPHLWGRGYASEAVRALLTFGFDELGEKRIYARTDPPNVASMRVMEKAGMSYLEREYDGDIELVTYVMEKSTHTGDQPLTTSHRSPLA
jgi:RimJ/RimL family protein N-acetyltransferase